MPRAASTGTKLRSTKLAPLFEHRDPRAQYYSVAISDEAIMALGRSDSAVRLFDAHGGKKRGTAPLRLPDVAASWVHAIAIDSQRVVAATNRSIDCHRIDLASHAIDRVPNRSVTHAIALRDGKLALAAENCIAGTVLQLDSYCGMPIAEGAVFAAVAMHSDASRIAAYRLDAGWRAGAKGSRITLAGFTGEIHGPPRHNAHAWQLAITLTQPQFAKLPALGWLGDAVVVAERDPKGFAGLHVIGGRRARRIAWPKGFVAAEVAFAARVAIAIDERGRIAVALPDHTTQLTRVTVDPPVANVAVSGNARYLAYAAAFEVCRVYDLGAVAKPSE